MVELTIWTLLGILIGIETLYILFLYERISRLNRKLWELEWINKGKRLAEKDLKNYKK